MASSHSIQMDGTRFWVTHRRRRYGPFDYAWSPDFCGMELLYNGSKFGEYCSREEIYADLRGFSLPMRVVQVSSVVMGCVLSSVLDGLNESERYSLLQERLEEFGLARFWHHEAES